MIYVDEIMKWPTGQWCHMMTDGDLSELHAFAAHLGLKRSWFQNKPRHPHYNLRPTKRTLAIQRGAIAVSSTELITINSAESPRTLVVGVCQKRYKAASR